MSQVSQESQASHIRQGATASKIFDPPGHSTTCLRGLRGLRCLRGLTGLTGVSCETSETCEMPETCETSQTSETCETHRVREMISTGEPWVPRRGHFEISPDIS